MLSLFCLVATGLGAFYAEKTESRKALFLISITLSIFCGFRSEDLWIDTKNYYIYFSNLSVLGKYYGKDLGFALLSNLLMWILKSPVNVLLIYAFITNSLIIYRLWHFKNNASFFWMTILYFVAHYQYTYILTRQYLAISIVFWATRYIKKKKYAAFSFLVIIAASIHASALIGFLYLIISGLCSKQRKYTSMYIFFTIFSPLFGIIMFNTSISRFGTYFESASIDLHEIILFKILCVAFVLSFNKTYVNKASAVANVDFPITLDRELVMSYQLGLLLSALGMFYLYMNRIGFYFILFEIPFWGQVIKANKGRLITNIFFAFIILFYSVMIVF